jgi:hypothetical protein
MHDIDALKVRHCQLRLFLAHVQFPDLVKRASLFAAASGFLRQQRLECSFRFLGLAAPRVNGCLG